MQHVAEGLVRINRYLGRLRDIAQSVVHLARNRPTACVAKWLFASLNFGSAEPRMRSVADLKTIRELRGKGGALGVCDHGAGKLAA